MKDGRCGIMRVKTLRDSLENTSNALHFSSQNDKNNDSSKMSAVRFKDVIIREYDIVIGDNPSCSSGVPICLDWSYSPKETMNVDAFEQCRGRRTRDCLIMPPRTRHNLLMDGFDYPMFTIIQALNEANEVREEQFRLFQDALSRVRNNISLIDEECNGEENHQVRGQMITS